MTFNVCHLRTYLHMYAILELLTRKRSKMSTLRDTHKTGENRAQSSFSSCHALSLALRFHRCPLVLFHPGNGPSLLKPVALFPFKISRCLRCSPPWPIVTYRGLLFVLWPIHRGDCPLSLLATITNSSWPLTSSYLCAFKTSSPLEC